MLFVLREKLFDKKPHGLTTLMAIDGWNKAPLGFVSGEV
jgi:hypothetical protein